MSAVTSSRVRRVIIDDEDRNIIYRGPWTVNTTSFEEYPHFGYVYRGSQHRLLDDTGSLTFRFVGSGSVAILGTSDALNVSGVYDPFYTCKLDGVDVPPQKPLGMPVNLWPLCRTNSTDEGDHVLTLSVVSDSKALFVDQIAYIPDRRSPPQSPTVSIFHDDLAVEYIEGSWQGDGADGMLTEEAGAKLSITFTGSSARFIGSVPLEYPGANSTATYSINGAPPVTFTVPGLGRNNLLLPMFGQPFFEIKDLGSGIHELIVTHNGPAAPLVFEYLEVEDGDIVQSSLSREVEEAAVPSGGKKPPLGAIIGGAVGGAVFLLALLAFHLLMKKRKKPRAQADVAVPVTFTPFDSLKSPLPPAYEVEPLRHSHQLPPSTFQTMSNPGTGESLQHGPMPGFYGHHTSHSTSSHPGNQPTNPSAHYPSPNSFGPLAPMNMSVTYARNSQTYSRAPEPMA